MAEDNSETIENPDDDFLSAKWDYAAMLALLVVVCFMIVGVLGWTQERGNADRAQGIIQSLATTYGADDVKLPKNPELTPTRTLTGVIVTRDGVAHACSLNIPKKNAWDELEADCAPRLTTRG